MPATAGDFNASAAGADHDVAFCLSMILSENRNPLFGIIL